MRAPTAIIRTAHIHEGISPEFMNGLQSLTKGLDEAGPGEIVAHASSYGRIATFSDTITFRGYSALSMNRNGLAFTSERGMMANRAFRRSTLIDWAATSDHASRSEHTLLASQFERHARASQEGIIGLVTPFGALSVRATFGGVADPLFLKTPVHCDQKKVDQIVRAYVFGAEPDTSHAIMERKLNLGRLDAIWQSISKILAPKRVAIRNLKTSTEW